MCQGYELRSVSPAAHPVLSADIQRGVRFTAKDTMLAACGLNPADRRRGAAGFIGSRAASGHPNPSTMPTVNPPRRRRSIAAIACTAGCWSSCPSAAVTVLSYKAEGTPTARRPPAAAALFLCAAAPRSARQSQRWSSWQAFPAFSRTATTGRWQVPLDYSSRSAPPTARSGHCDCVQTIRVMMGNTAGYRVATLPTGRPAEHTATSAIRRRDGVITGSGSPRARSRRTWPRGIWGRVSSLCRASIYGRVLCPTWRFCCHMAGRLSSPSMPIGAASRASMRPCGHWLWLDRLWAIKRRWRYGTR